MSFRVDFSGYGVMLPFIEDAKASRLSSSNVVKRIKKNRALSGVFEFMKNDNKVSADVLLNIIHNAFSQRVGEKASRNRSLRYLIKTYDWCNKNWNLVKASVDWLRSTDLEPVVKERAAYYLPRDVAFPDVMVYFAFDGCDGRGFKSKVYMDVTLCAILGREKSIGLLAHEYHHSCRADFAQKCSNTKWKNIFDTLFYLESEGVADKIYDLGGVLPDNRFLPITQAIRQRKRFYLNAHKYLADVEKGILKNVDPLKTFSGGKNHPLGKYMADLIERKLGKAKLIYCVGHPFEFLKTYNEAAILEKEKIVKTFVFSKGVMAKLDDIQRILGVV
jgi:hypothetical protein